MDSLGPLIAGTTIAQNSNTVNRNTASENRVVFLLCWEFLAQGGKHEHGGELCADF